MKSNSSASSSLSIHKHHSFIPLIPGKTTLNNFCQNQLKPSPNKIPLLLQAIDVKQKPQFQYDLLSKNLPKTLRNSPIPSSNSHKRNRLQSKIPSNSTSSVHNNSYSFKPRILHDSLLSFQQLYHDYTTSNKRNKNKYIKLNKENKSFSDEYHSIENKKNHNQVHSYIHNQGVFNVVNEYANRNVKIPDISCTNNKTIFNKNPLILQQKELTKYFLFNSREVVLHKQNKTIDFLNKLYNTLRNKLNSDSSDSLSASFNDSPLIQNASNLKNQKKVRTITPLYKNIASQEKEINSLIKACDDVEEYDYSMSQRANKKLFTNTSRLNRASKYKHSKKSIGTINHIEVETQPISCSESIKNTTLNSNMSYSMDSTLERLYNKSKKQEENFRNDYYLQSGFQFNNIMKYLSDKKDKQYNLTKDVSSKSTYCHLKRSKDMFVKNYIKEEYDIRNSKSKRVLNEKEIKLIDKSDLLHKELLQCEGTMRKMVYEGKLYKSN